MTSNPLRWHVYSVDLEPRIGTKPGKQRPCLVIQPSYFSQHGLKSSVIIPITSKEGKVDLYPLRVRLGKGIAGLLHDSELLVDQILAWDNSFFRKDLGKIPDVIKHEILQAIQDFLSLDTIEDPQV